MNQYFHLRIELVTRGLKLFILLVLTETMIATVPTLGTKKTEVHTTPPPRISQTTEPKGLDEIPNTARVGNFKTLELMRSAASEAFTTHTPDKDLEKRTHCTGHAGSFNEMNDTYTVRVTKTEGEVVWNEDNSTSVCSWLIVAEPQYSIVLQFIDVQLQRGHSADSIDIVVIADNGTEPAQENELRRIAGNNPVPPVLVKSNQVLVRMVKHTDNTSDGDVLGNSCIRQSSFRLKYQTLHTTVLPPETGTGRYNCSPPYEVPEAFKCDMVEQCNDGEDEKNSECQHQGPNCRSGEIFQQWSDWSACIKIIAPNYPVSPDEAFVDCMKDAAQVGFFHEEDSRQFATRVTALSGREEMIVSLSPKQKPTYIKELNHFYRLVAQWNKRWRIFDEPQPQFLEQVSECAVLRVNPVPHLRPVRCTDKALRIYTCLRDTKPRPKSLRRHEITLPNATGIGNKFPTKSCLDGSHVQPFHPCESESQGATWSRSGIPLLRCNNGKNVHYSLFCDGVDDCGDSTDEGGDMCQKTIFYRKLYERYSHCERTRDLFPKELKCDGRQYCSDGSDEEYCTVCQKDMVPCAGLGCIPKNYINRGLRMCLHHEKQSDCVHQEPEVRFDQNVSAQQQCPGPNSTDTNSVMLNLDGYGLGNLTHLHGADCPETHFRCSDGFCIPTFLLNNEEYDCPFPDEEDEEIESLSCPGHYRCYRHQLCIHPEFLCDGIYHCPFRDDERYCDLTCPPDCTCEGHAYTCKGMFNMMEYPFVRYLDLSGVILSKTKLVLFGYIQFLNLSACGLSQVKVKLAVHIKVLDLSFNEFTELRTLVFERMMALEHLNLSNNPLVPSLNQFFDVLFGSTDIKHLRSLTIRGTGITNFGEGSFANMTSLQHLDIRENNIKDMGRGMFRGLETLKTLHTDDPKLCCSYFSQYPASKADCEAPEDDLSSCSELLRSNFFRISLWIFAFLAISGNAGVFLYRVFCEVRRKCSGFCILVSNLCVSDFLMGIYVLIIGVADAIYAGEYAWKSSEWKTSVACQAAGFLALVSSEVSAFIICLIMLDRLLVLKFPIHHKLRLTPRMLTVACTIAWVLGICLAALPLLLARGEWQFYSQTSICLPLPITQQQFPGQQYAFGLFIVLNFVLFLLIGAGQMLIYHAAKPSPLIASNKRRQQDMILARRLFLVVFTDFCCWFPVGVMGLLAAGGASLPGEVNVIVAVFALPINSAINPFLYTLNALLESREKRKRETRVKRMLSMLNVDLHAWPPERVQELKRQCERILCRQKSQAAVHSLERFPGVHGDSRMGFPEDIAVSNHAAESTSFLELEECNTESTRCVDSNSQLPLVEF